MLQLNEVAGHGGPYDDALTLPFETRQRSRFSATTDQGREVGVFLPRGQMLRSGTVLTGPEQVRIAVLAAPEALSVVRTEDRLQFARLCYHLGNRHVSLQIRPGELCYLADHVLDLMVASFGVRIEHESAPFEPEAGAYHAHGH